MAASISTVGQISNSDGVIGFCYQAVPIPSRASTSRVKPVIASPTSPRAAITASACARGAGGSRSAKTRPQRPVIASEVRSGQAAPAQPRTVEIYEDLVTALQRHASICSRLRADGQFLISAEPRLPFYQEASSGPGGGPPRPKTSGTVSRKDILAFTEYLFAATQAGIPILTTLDDVAAQLESRKMRDIIRDMLSWQPSAITRAWRGRATRRPGAGRPRATCAARRSRRQCRTSSRTASRPCAPRGRRAPHGARAARRRVP